jgi:hypothetical protein
MDIDDNFFAIWWVPVDGWEGVDGSSEIRRVGIIDIAQVDEGLTQTTIIETSSNGEVVRCVSPSRAQIIFVEGE